jgi:hypothetical protein
VRGVSWDAVSGELERYFFLDDADRELVQAKRRPHNRLGFATPMPARSPPPAVSPTYELPWPPANTRSDSATAAPATPGTDSRPAPTSSPGNSSVSGSGPLAA